MSKKLTAEGIDIELLSLGINYRWRAIVDGFSVIYNCYNFVFVSKKVDYLLRLRAVIEAIDKSGSPNGVPLQSHEVLLLVSERKSFTQKIGALDQKQKDHDSRSRGGKSGKGKARNARSYAIREAFRNLGYDATTDAVIDWLLDKKVHLKIKDGLDLFNATGFKSMESEHKNTRKAINTLRSNKKTKK